MNKSYVVSRYGRNGKLEVTPHDWQPHKDTAMSVCKKCRIIRLCINPDYSVGCFRSKENML